MKGFRATFNSNCLTLIVIVITEWAVLRKYIFTQESTKIIKFQYTLIQTYRPENENCLGVVPKRRYQSTFYINDMDEKRSHWDFIIKILINHKNSPPKLDHQQKI